MSEIPEPLTPACSRRLLANSRRADDSMRGGISDVQKTALYRAFDATRRLLYVGISSNALRRLSQHRGRADWFCELAYLEVEWFETRDLALAAERTAIKAERPAFNIVHTLADAETAADAVTAGETAPPIREDCFQKPLEPAPLAGTSFVGLCFHIFGADRAPRYQGHIIGLVDGGYALVQFFEWMFGEPNTIRLFALADILEGCARPYRSDGSWIFHENSEAMCRWYADRERMFNRGKAA
jgi:predicted GIY-YIG superfamily endonuclease